jgi:site-specific DNA-methyltransferase (adenine-specific)
MAQYPDVVKQVAEQALEDKDILSQAKIDIKIRIHKNNLQRNKVAKSLENKSCGTIDIFTTKNKYKIIYADPPWQYDQTRQSRAAPDSHYATMPLTDICNLPIKRILQKNAVLFLWTTSSLLYDAMKVIDSWGFKYKSTFIWGKTQKNGKYIAYPGHYTNVVHESLLIATKGHCAPDYYKNYNSIQNLPRTKHSAKPQEFRRIIESLYVGDKIELFARESSKGWDTWGNESALS